ncbi:unnamed protein product [Dracunculus medinensis]|uniref:Spermidine synthase n=1 Tax=Dracunculus medinensis TaxID=318479 RepID=A0A158Q4X4_DRAME|nr:unnamed protein product [Dracunculus medinensis]
MDFAHIVTLPMENFKMDGSIFNIRDEAIRHLNGSITIERQMTIENFGSRIVASMHLKIPEDLKGNSLDTRKLSANHIQITILYLKAMIAAPFVTSTFGNSSEQFSSLSIGLGIGIINSFLHDRFTNINITIIEIEKTMVDIAKKYFGLIEDDRQRVIISDGMKYLRENKKLIFDAIFIDACYSQFKDGLSCPVKEFCEYDNMNLIKSNLKENGVVIVSLLLTSPKKTAEVLVCGGKNFPDEETFKAKTTKVFEELGFGSPPIVTEDFTMWY